MLRDVRMAIRRFWFRPAQTVMMTLVVGAGIGASTAVFSVVDQTILRPPPFAEPERLVQVLDLFRDANARSTNLTLEKIAGWQQQRAMFEALEGYAFRRVDLTGDGGEPERLAGFVVTNGLFHLLGVQPSLGRTFTADEGKPGAEPVALISHGLWKRRFGGRPDVLGMRIALSDQPHAIVGVMPRGFRIHGEDEDVWLPIDVHAGTGVPGPGGMVGLGRLARGVDARSAQELADTLSARLQQQTPMPSPPFWDIHIEPKKVATVDRTTRTALFVLLAAVGFVLLIACANTASLLLSQLGVRRRETAIRAAIGASRGRLFREALIESVLLSCCGGVIGIFLATWGVDAIVAAAPPNFVYNPTSPIAVDLRILLVAAGVTLATGLIFGLVPALRASSPHVETMLKSGAVGGTGRTPQATGAAALVVAEVAFSLILLVGAALMARTFVNLHGLAPGFDPDGVVAVSLSLPTDKYVDEGARSAFFAMLRARLVALPGVSDVAIASKLFGGSGITFASVEEFEGRDPDAPAGRIELPANTVTADYFRALRIPVVAGRVFEDGDGDEAVVVSRSFAERLWPGGRAVGRQFRIGRMSPRRTIVGVVGDLEPRAGDLGTSFHLYRQFARPAAPTGTTPRVRRYAERTLVIRADDPASIVPAVRAAVWGIDPNQPIGRVDLAADLYANAFGRERFVLQLMAVFGAIALVLTAAGIFGVLSQVVATRTREIGVRVALGAPALDIARLVIARALLPTVAGTVLGLGGAIALTRFLEALLFQVRPLDPVSFGVVTALLIAIALVASWLPTRRAMRVDPVVVLRE